MKMLKKDRIEPWSYPIPHYAEQAQVWHARRFASWLLKAGAEPRFGTLLSSGTQAETRWQLLLEEQGVEVLKVRSSFDRPLPRELTEHRGDHFNRRLFLIDGLDHISQQLDESQRREFWFTLEGQRRQLKQSATWVVLNIQDLTTLSELSEFAPNVLGEVDRVCLMWVAQEAARSVEKRTFHARRHQIVYDIFSTLVNARERTETFKLGRVFRAGYMAPPRGSSEQWKWAYRLWRGEVRDKTAARFGQLGVTEPLSSEVSPDDALWALLGRGEAATPARREQWMERARQSMYGWRVTGEAAAFEAHLEGCMTLDQRERKSMLSLGRWGMAESDTSLRSEDLTQAERGVQKLEGGFKLMRALMTEWLTRAYAQCEDLQGCIRVNENLLKSGEDWLEAKFCSYERLLDLSLFIQDHNGAKQIVEALEVLTRDLHSPLFEVRFLEAKSKQLGALDPSRGEGVLASAHSLADRFGLTWLPNQ